MEMLGGSAWNESLPEGTATKRRVEITLERHRVLAVRPRAALTIAWCEQCGMRGEVLSAEEAGRRTSTSTRAIYRRVEAAEVHYAENEDGSLLICARSLDELFNDRES